MISFETEIWKLAEEVKCTNKVSADGKNVRVAGKNDGRIPQPSDPRSTFGNVVDAVTCDNVIMKSSESGVRVATPNIT